MITLYPGAPSSDGGCLVVYRGTPDRSVNWSLSGTGTLTPITSATDHNGVAGARYVAAGGAGTTITITVTAGACRGR